jgi:hypothetical protein
MHHVLPDGRDSDDVLKYGFLNSYFEAGLADIMDEAVLDHAHLEDSVRAEDGRSWMNSRSTLSDVVFLCSSRVPKHLLS